MEEGEVPHIRRLDESVVNRIAAGEIIQRPANALKEMLENSIDAGATQINVVAQGGGADLLQIQDNGHGIRREDLAMLCERHTTSKLRQFEDLRGIRTLGFRGEALASISYVARLSVLTMTAGSEHGWRADYTDGVLDKGSPKPAAATKGTTITVEGLYQNVPLRRKALKSASEEYSQLLDAMGRYAVFHAGVAMSCRRQGEARTDLHTLAGATRLEAIRAVYGAPVAKHVLPLSLECGEGVGEGAGEDELSCKVEGFVSGADYAGKRTQLVLFINARSVECTPLKRALEAAYATLLPKAAKPFVFLDVRLPGAHVDVNMHPTKREVGFLHQEELIDAVRAAVEERLLGSNTQRTYTQMRLPGAPAVDLPEAVPSQPSYYRPDKLVRTDARAQTLHAFLAPQQEQERVQGAGDHEPGTSSAAAAVAKATEAAAADPGSEPDDPLHAASAAAAAAAAPAARRRQAAVGAEGAPGMHDFAFMPTAMEISGAVATQQPQLRRPVRQQRNPQPGGMQGEGCTPQCVEGLLEDAERAQHAGLVEVLQRCTYVGLADETLALIQHGTRLYLMDLQRFSHDMFFQQALRRCGKCRSVQLDPPLSLEALVVAALEAHEALGKWEDSEEGGTKQGVAALLRQLLQQRAGQLRQWFAIDVDGDGNLCSLPQLIEQCLPDMDRLPLFVLALGQHVEWGDDATCVRGVAQALAEFYKVQPSIAAASAEAGDEDAQRALQYREWVAKHVVLPALRQFLTPTRQRAADGTVVELTRLETLYRVFERC